MKGHVGSTAGTGLVGTFTDGRAGTDKQDATRAGMEVYQFTESGGALQATVSGPKYWQGFKLNRMGTSQCIVTAKRRFEK